MLKCIERTNRRSVAWAVKRLHGAAAVHVVPVPFGAATMTCTAGVVGVAALEPSGTASAATRAIAAPIASRGWLTPVSVKIWGT
jgi:hypothetical protein